MLVISQDCYLAKPNQEGQPIEECDEYIGRAKPKRPALLNEVINVLAANPKGKPV